MRWGIAIAAALTLTACDRGNAPSEAVTATPSDKPMPVEPDGSGGGGSGGGIESGIGDGAGPIPGETSANALVIPAKFHGVWDYEKGTCALESDLRMEVGASDIRFYESYGKVTAVRRDGADAIIDLAMEGEGETWDNSIRLTFSPDGERLLSLDTRQTIATDSDLPRKKCPE